jgi:protein-arginine kinase activator protein McsA
MIDYKLYPPNWTSEIVPRILARADHKCEECGEPNGMYLNKFTRKPNLPSEEDTIKIVLTIAHLDHDPENWDVKDERLKALCQRCHLNYDRSRHIAKRKYGREYFKHPKLDL